MKKTKQDLLAENEELRARLDEAEETLNAIRSGEVDALIVSGKDGQQIYTLTGADRTYRLLLESMREGAVTLNLDGFIIYCNSFFAGLLKIPLDKLTGAHLLDFVPQSERQQFVSLLAQCDRGEITLQAADSSLVPVYLSVNRLVTEPGQPFTCVIVTDLSEQKRDEKIIAEGMLAKIILEKAPESIIVCDEKGKIILASISAHALCGQNPLYKPFDEMFPLTLDRGKHFAITQALSNQEVQSSEASFLRKGGAPFDLVLTSAPLADENNKLIGCIVTLSDITAHKQAEEALRASEQRFRVLAEKMPHFVWEADRVGMPLYANKRFYDYSGLNPEQALSGGWLAMQHPEDIPRVEAAWQQALTTCAEYDLESRFREEATGAYRWFRIKGSPVRDAAGKIFRWVGTCTDIHEQKQAEEALKKSERFYRAIGESIDYGIWVCAPDGRNIYASESFLKLVGLTQEQCSNFGWGDVLHPDDAQRTIVAWKECVRTGGQWDIEHRFKGVDEQWHPILARGVPVRDEQGNIECWAGINLDISNIKLAEEAVRESEDRLNFALTTIHTGAWDLDLVDHTAHRTLDHDRIFGYDTLLPQWTYEMFIEHVLPEDRAEVDRKFLDAVKTQTDWSFECRIRRADGDIRWILAAGSHRTDINGQIRRMAGIVQDITEHKRLEEEQTRLLKSIQEEKDRLQALVNSISDEIWFADTRKRFTLANPTALDAFGLNIATDTIDVQKFAENLEVYRPDGSPRPIEEAPPLRSLGGEAVKNQEEIVRVPASGELRHRQVSSNPVRDAGGQIIGSVSVVRDITERKAIEKAQLFLLQCGQKEGEDFFESLAVYLAENLGMDFVCIDKLVGDSLSARTLAMYCDGKFEDNIEYTLRDTPCGDVVGKQVCSFAQDVRRLFPKDAALQDLRAESYVGTTLWSAQGKSIGLIAVIGRKPLADTSFAETILQLVSIRAAGELERRQAETQLRSIAQFPEENPAPVLRVAENGTLLYANQASQNVLDFWQCREGEPVPAQVQKVLHEALRSGMTREMESTFSNRTKLLFMIAPICRQNYCNIYGRDITAIRQAEDNLRTTNARLDILADSASQLLRSEMPQNIVEVLCRRVMAFLDCQAFFNFLVDEKRGQLHLNAFAGIPQEEAAKIEWLDYGIAVCGCAARDGCRIVAEDILNTPDIRTELVKSYGIQAYACHPLISQGEVIGTLSFGTHTRPHFTEDELSLMKAVADQVAIAMERNLAQNQIAQLYQNLQRKVQELEAIFTTVPIGITIADDPAGQHIRGNPAIERILGAPTGGELSLNPVSGRARAEYKAQFDGQELPVQKLPMQRAARGETVVGQMLDIVRQDGRTLNLYSNAAPLFDEQGRPRGAVGAFLDITELKQAEAELQLYLDRLDILIKVSVAIIAATTAGGMLRETAEAARELTGARVAVTGHGYIHGHFQVGASSQAQDRQPCPEVTQFVIQKGGILLGIIGRGESICFTDQEMRSHPDWWGLPEGHCPLRGLCCAPLTSMDGLPNGLIMVSDKTGGDFTELDASLITQLAVVASLSLQHIEAHTEVEKKAGDLALANQQLEEEVRRRSLAEQILKQYADDLARSNEELESFASAISHDLQEPLRSIAGFIRLLEKKYGDLLDSRGREYIERSVASSKRLGGMINSLLSYSRITTRGRDFENYELASILETALENLNASISQANALITHDPLPPIYGDPDQLARVFQNLIGNSIKYSGSSRPEIHVSWQRKGDACIIAVKDNGEGIEPEYLENIFQLFTRGSAKQNISGTGMGLAVCKKIIDRHKGKIWAESEPGKGSVFFISLPVG